ncbi:MAG: type II toxin-antitoxin system Phd/YefM family antitoxin [Actinomycetes bacterium]
MAISITELRSNLYRLVDRVLADGTPLEIERNGRLLTISATPPTSKFDALAVRPDVIAGDPEDLVHGDWSDEWRPM